MEIIIKKMGRMISKLLLFLLILTSCNSKNEFDGVFSDTYNSTIDIYQKRDSIFLTHISNEFYRLGIDGKYIGIKEEYNRYLKENDTSLIKRFVPVRIFYNDKKTKLFAFVVFAVALKKDTTWPKGFDHFTSFTVAGFRDSSCQPWRIYPYERITLAGAPTLDTILYDLNKFYFYDLKEEFNPYETNKNGGMAKYRYNLGDSKFWSEFFDMKKGSRGNVDSLYGFQFEFGNPHYTEFIKRGFKDYTKNLKFEKYAKEANSKFKQRSIEWQLYIWRNKLQDTSITFEQIRFKKDSLNLEIVQKFIDSNITMKDVINKGIDHYTYKPKIDSVRYPEYLLKMYECK